MGTEESESKATVNSSSHARKRSKLRRRALAKLETRRLAAYRVRAAAALKIQRWYKSQDPAVRARLGRRWSETESESSDSDIEDESVAREQREAFCEVACQCMHHFACIIIHAWRIYSIIIASSPGSLLPPEVNWTKAGGSLGSEIT